MVFGLSNDYIIKLLTKESITRYVGNCKTEKCSIHQKLSADFLVADLEHSITILKDLLHEKVTYYKKTIADKNFLDAMCSLLIDDDEDNLNYLYDSMLFKIEHE